MKRTIALVAPYAAWMALMAALTQTALSYALRGAVTAIFLIAGWWSFGRCNSVDRHDRHADFSLGCRVVAGVSVGLVVFAVWIAPEVWLWPNGVEGELSPYHPQACGWALTLAKLCASAFVISIAEELFFRKWLVEFAGFGWMLVLFGVEHMRWDLGNARGCVFIAEGVFAGLCYGLLAKKCGILSAIIAHTVTNLVLGLYVIFANKWFYW